MNRSASVLLSLLLSSAVHAKCATETYIIGGFIGSYPDSAPVEGAEISVAYGENAGGMSAARTAVAQTGKDGHYSVELRFYPLGSSRRGSDECNAKLTSVSVSVSAAGFESLSQLLSLNGTVATANYSLKRTAANGGGVD